MLYDEYTEQFLAYHKHSTEWGRSVWLSTCKEFGDWSEAVLVFHTDEQDRENAARRIQAVADDPDYLTPPIIDEQDYVAQIYMMSVMPYEGLYVGFPVLYNPSGLIPPPRRNATGISQVELTVSRDLYNWDRVADRADVHPAGQVGRRELRHEPDAHVRAAHRARRRRDLGLLQRLPRPRVQAALLVRPGVQPHRPIVLQRLGRERHRALPGQGAAPRLRLPGRAGRGLIDDEAVRGGRHAPSRQRRRSRRDPGRAAWTPTRWSRWTASPRTSATPCRAIA